MYPASKTTPWNHQIEAWNLIKNNPAFYLAHDMGCIDGDAIININRASNGRKIKLMIQQKCHRHDIMVDIYISEITY